MKPNHPFKSTLLISKSSSKLDAESIAVFVYKNGILTSLEVATERLSKGVYSYSFDVPDWEESTSVDVHFEVFVDGFKTYEKKHFYITKSTIDYFETEICK